MPIKDVPGDGNIKDVPGDGNCLLWAVMVSYLEQVKTNKQQFKVRYEKLFGAQEGRERIFNFNNFDYNKNVNLVQKFRNHICDYIEKNLDEERGESKADFRSMLLDSEINKKIKESHPDDEEKQIKKTLKQMRKNGTYTGSVELEAICNILGCNIIRNNGNNWSETFEPDNSQSDSEIKLHYKDRHYKYYSNITNNSEENISTTPNILDNEILSFLNQLVVSKDINDKNAKAIINIFIQDFEKAPKDKLDEILERFIFELENQNEILAIANYKSQQKDVNNTKNRTVPLNNVNNTSKNKKRNYETKKITDNDILKITVLLALLNEMVKKIVYATCINISNVNNASKKKTDENPSQNFEDLVKPIINDPKTCAQETRKNENNVWRWPPIIGVS